MNRLTVLRWFALIALARRGLVAAAVGASVAAVGWLPSLAQTPSSTLLSKSRGADLARAIPFDRITLIDGTVLEVEPIFPRPLPVPDTKKAGKSLVELDEKAQKAKPKRPNRGGNNRDNDEPEEEEVVIIHCLEGEPRDFKIKRTSIRSVDFFEDLLLADSDRLITDEDFTRAFERLQLVKSRDANWKGLDEAVNRLLFAEGSATLLEDSGRGLQLLNDLLARAPNHPGLIDTLVKAFGSKIDRSIAVGDFFAGRELLGTMSKLAGVHPQTAATRNKFVNRAKALMTEAAKSNPTEKVDRLAEASRIWPELEGLPSAYGEAFRAMPTVRVAVADLADPVGPFPQSPAADRVARLVYVPVVATDDEASLRGETNGQLLAEWKLSELGAVWRIGLRSQFQWSDGSRPVAAIDVARSLADRASPGSPGYCSRWADLLDRITVLDENRLEVKLTRATARPETWLLESIAPAHAAADGWVSSVSGGRRPVGDGPYIAKGTDAGGLTFEAAPLAPPDIVPKVRRIVEVRAQSALSLAERLARGEIDLIDHVPPSELAPLAKVPDIRVGTYGTPSVHRLAIDGRSPALANRKLRRALSMALDRSTLLTDQILGRSPDGLNRVSDAPFVRGSFVAEPSVPPLEYHPTLAKGLVAAALKELGVTTIHLNLEYPGIAEARATVPKIADAFRAIGVEVTTTELPESTLEAGLRQGRRFDLAYRASRPTDPLRDVGPLLIPAYDAPSESGGFASAASPRILQLLIELDRAPEPQSARRTAVEIDREARDELPVIPLWQVEDHYAWRTNIRGIAAATDQFYRGVTTWEAEPWLAKAP